MGLDVRESVVGLHAVRVALERGQLRELWCDWRRHDERLEAIRCAAAERGVEVHEIANRELDALLPGVRHQGVIGRLHPPRERNERDLEELLEGLGHPPFLLVLDGVQDPHNLGACLRTADAAGVDAVIVPKDRAVGLTATVHKVACGAAQTVPLVRVTNLARTLRYLRDAGVWLVGTAGEGTRTIHQIDLTGPLALVMGAEGKGLRRLTREHCDLLASIPMHGVVESLNVSVATGICLYEALRQRRHS